MSLRFRVEAISAVAIDYHNERVEVRLTPLPHPINAEDDPVLIPDRVILQMGHREARQFHIGDEIQIGGILNQSAAGAMQGIAPPTAAEA